MSRKAKILTVKAIDAAISTIKKAERDSLELGDGHAPGLILTLRRGAQGLIAFWVYRKQKTKSFRGCKLGLGSYPAVSLEQARKQALTYAQQIAEGIDPKKARDCERAQKTEARRKAEEEARRGKPFREVALMWLDAADAKGEFADNSRGRDKAEGALRKWVNPVLGDRPVNEIDRAAVVELIHYKDLGAMRDTEQYCRRIVNKVCTWATVHGYRDESRNPCPASMRDPLLATACKGLVKKRPPKGHNPALPPECMPEFMAQLNKLDTVGAKALAFMILTCARQDSICHDEKGDGTYLGLRWEHIDLTKGIWHQPRDWTKTKRDAGMTLMLSSYAKSLLMSLLRFEGEPYVFSSAKSKGHSIGLGTMGSVIRGMNRAREQLGMALFIDPQQNREVVPHGMRTCFRSWLKHAALHGLRFDPELAELCLDHVDGDKFGGAYNRMGLSEEDDKERLKIMEAWGRYCMEGKWPDEE